MPVHYSKDSAGPSTRRALLGVMYFEPTGPEYDSWTKAELVAEAKARGLAATGTKADLIARLRSGD